MPRFLRPATALAAAGLALSLAHPAGPAAGPAAAAPSASGPSAAAPSASAPSASAPSDVRFMTYNASLNRSGAGALLADLSTPDSSQARAVAEVIQRNQPDVLLLNEFDYYPGNAAAALFNDNYLGVSQNGQTALDYPYIYTAPVNTGVPSGFDLNNDGRVGGGDDAFGFGLFPGQYGMAVFSKHPLDLAGVRTFQDFLWKDMPGALLPDDPATPAPADWYSPEELDAVRLSSKSHWDIPVMVGGTTVHVLAAHPTPPTFDGAEDRNGTRNHDEIRLWADYTTPGASDYLYDDAGTRGGLRPGERFVIMGDYNADTADGDSTAGAIGQLLGHHRIQDPRPTSAGGAEAALLQGGANLAHTGDPALDTADFADGAPGNLRVDYVLPSKNLRVTGSSVYWPAQGEPGSELTGTYPFPTSDHRPVVLDVRV
jgi:endonuclease/exonuclease/phosphatase family metal-dependent hydrolase